MMNKKIINININVIMNKYLKLMKIIHIHNQTQQIITNI